MCNNDNVRGLDDLFTQEDRRYPPGTTNKPEAEPISPQEVDFVLSFFSPQQNKELIEEGINEIISKSRCCSSQDKSPIIKLEDGCSTVSFSKSLFKLKETSSSEEKCSRMFFKFLFGIANLLPTKTFCFTVKADGTYKHMVFLKEDFDLCEVSNDKELRTEKGRNISKVFKNLINAGGVIDINNSELKFKSIHHCGGLVIRNIDCDVDIQNEVIQYTNAIVKKLIDKLGIHLSVASGTLYQLALGPNCNPRIPIIMKKVKHNYEKDRKWEKVDKLYRPTGKMLGYYTRNEDDEGFCQGPHIVLDADEIKNSSVDPLSFKILFTKVLVHELAHAIMDKYLDEQNEKTKNDNWPNSKETLAIEESLANMITLQCFKEFAPDDYPYVLNYIDQRQSALYQFGIWQEQIGANWEKWRDNSKQGTSQIKDWFNKCFVDGYIRIPKEYYTKEMFDKVFE